MGTHVIRLRRLGIPQSSREIFLLLEKSNLISQGLSQELQAMVGFRNIAVHNYISLNLEVVRSIIENNLGVFLKFNQVMLQLDINN